MMPSYQNFIRRTRTLILGTFALTIVASNAFGQSSSSPSSSPTGTRPSTTKTQTTPAAPAKTEAKHGFQALPKRNLPSMDKPFGMPGVVGYKDGKWEGTDYLGHVANGISISVEVVKGADYEGDSVDEGTLNSLITELLKDGGIDAHAEVKEGPPLPFLHVLIMIYPVDAGKVVIYGSVRLFESVQVMRKNFSPAGYWQAITWESQDMILVSTNRISEEAKSLTEGLIKGFISRYKLYNAVSDPGLPPPPALKKKQV